MTNMLSPEEIDALLFGPGKTHATLDTILLSHEELTEALAYSERYRQIEAEGNAVKAIENEKLIEIIRDLREQLEEAKDANDGCRELRIKDAVVESHLRTEVIRYSNVNRLIYSALNATIKERSRILQMLNVEHGRIGAYLNELVADCGLTDKGQYLRDLFGRFEDEARRVVPPTTDDAFAKLGAIVYTLMVQEKSDS